VSLARDVDADNQTLLHFSILTISWPIGGSWWVLVIKRVTITKHLEVKPKFTLPKGTHSLKLYVICVSS
jgi:hypothetical protein